MSPWKRHELKAVTVAADVTTPTKPLQPTLEEMATAITEAMNHLVHCQAEKARWEQREVEARADLDQTQKMFFEALEKRGIHARPR